MAATDLFDSDEGQFSGYTTLIGGTPPTTDYWFVEDFSTLGNITQISNSVSISQSGGIVATGGYSNVHEFQLNQKTNLLNFAAVVEVTTGANAMDYRVGVAGRRVTNNTCIIGKLNHQTSSLEIVKRVSGVESVLATEFCASLTSNTDYWLVVIFVDNQIRVEHWMMNPRMGGTPATQVTHTLTGSNATTYSIRSSAAIADWVPIEAKSKIKSVEIGFAFADNASAIDTTLAQKHVNIRDFINYRYPVRRRTIKELNTYHVNQKAFSQIITLNDPVTSGTFSILYYPTDNDPYVPISLGPFAHDQTSSQIKSTLNDALNMLPKFSRTSEDPIRNVVNSLGDATTPTLLIEFSEMFGDLSLLRMPLSDLSPSTTSIEGYDPTTGISTFDAVSFDQNYIETGDPLNTSSTVDELKIAYRYKNENWTLKKGFTGSTPPAGTSSPVRSQFQESDYSVGKISTKENTRGLNFSFARALTKVGTNWSVYMQSVNGVVNCTKIGKYPGQRPDLTTDGEDLTINMTFSDFPWDTGAGVALPGVNILNGWEDPARPGCFIQFTSAPDGSFAGPATSNPVSFKDHLYPQVSASDKDLVPGTIKPEFIAHLSEFMTASAEFDFWNITGVRIFFAGFARSPKNTSIEIMSIRCINNAVSGGVKHTSVEVNTLEENVYVPDLGYDQSIMKIPPMIRGDKIVTIGSDLNPLDSKESFIFQTGKFISESNVNRFMLFAREQELNDLIQSSWLTAEYSFAVRSSSTLKRYKTLRNKSYDNKTPALFWDIHPGGVFIEQYASANKGISYLPVLSGETNYELSLIVQGNNMSVEIDELTSAEQPDHTVYSSAVASSPEWSPVTGRIGWYAEFADKDMYINSFSLDSAAYAVLQTKQFKSETAIEGAQLFTVDSGNKNLFENFFTLNGSDRVYSDSQRTISGMGSYAFESKGRTLLPGVVSNQFTVDDWSHLFIEFDIWAPRQLKSKTLRPKFLLRPAEQPAGTNGIDVFSGVVPEGAPISFDFIPGAWSHVSFDMRGTRARSGDYYLVLVSDGDGDADASGFIGKWWVDNIKINTQTIEWEMRVSDNGLWAPFRNNVNKQYGGLHLPDDQIGNYIQLQARALTEDAWISEYTVLPKYVSMGRLFQNNMPVTVANNIVTGQTVVRATDLHYLKLAAIGNKNIVASTSILAFLNAFAVGEGEIDSSDFYTPRSGINVNESETVLGISEVYYESLKR